MILPTTLNFGVIAALLASAGAITAGWSQIKVFFQRILDLVICRVAVKGELNAALMSYVWDRGKRSPFGLKTFGGIKNYVHPNKRIEVIGYETISSDPILIWFNKRPIVIAKKRNHGNEDGPDVGDYGKDSMAPIFIWFFRGTFNVEDFLKKIIAHYNDLHHADKDILELDDNGDTKKINDRFQVIRINSVDSVSSAQPRTNYHFDAESSLDILKLLKTNSARLITWSKDDLVMKTRNKSAFTDYPFPAKIDEVLLELKLWKESQDWFKDRGIPWKRGYLLHGPPGSGKSTLVKSIAQEFNMPVYVFDLASETNSSFPRNFQTVQSNSPAILLIEDIDAVFNKRQNITKGLNPKESLTFDCLLNVISGVGNSDGVILFITTNDVSKLDSALGITSEDKSSRPGRIDKILFLGPMEEPERRKLAALILDDFPQNIEQTVLAGEGETAAQFQDRCTQLALKLFWARKNLK